MIRIVTENELKKIAKLDLEVVEAIEEGFSELEKGNATVPPIMMIPVHDREGEVDIKSAYVKGIDHLAVKVASGFFQNKSLGLPSQSGQMLVISAITGYLKAVLLDNGFLTQVRTGAAGAVAAKYLAPENTEEVGVIGAGVQARFQMEALKLVRDFKTIRMFCLDPEEEKERYVADIKASIGVDVIKCDSVQEVVENSSVVVTTTPSREGFLKPEWLHPGLHITAMGCDTEEKQELEAGVLGKADILACDLKSQCVRLGELRSGLQQKVISENTPITELGEMINGKKTGRTDAQQITVCDLTGVGVQDTMIAVKVFEIAETLDIGEKL